MTLEELKERENKLQMQLGKIQQKIKLIESTQLLEKFGVEIGDIIDVDGERGVVSAVDNDAIYYRPFRKNGQMQNKQKKIWQSFQTLTKVDYE